jgi:hypothetical protein
VRTVADGLLDVEDAVADDEGLVKDRLEEPVRLIDAVPVLVDDTLVDAVGVAVLITLTDAVAVLVDDTLVDAVGVAVLITLTDAVLVLVDDTLMDAVAVLVSETVGVSVAVIDVELVTVGVTEEEIETDHVDVHDSVALDEEVRLAEGDGLADVQLLAPPLLVVPAGHVVHDVAPDALKVPAAQGNVTIAWVRGRQ